MKVLAKKLGVVFLWIGFGQISNMGAQAQLDAVGALTIGTSLVSDSASNGTIRWTGFVFQGWTGVNWETLNSGVVVDIDGNRYKTVKIGTQEFMAENLKTSRYRNGAIIPNLTLDANWLNTSSGAWCWFDNSDANEAFGKLYNWYTIEDSREICPLGWHVPDEAEWLTLREYLGGLQQAGGRMKEIGDLYWMSPNTGASNESGFTALPNGSRADIGEFRSQNHFANFWSSTPTTTTASRYLGLISNDSIFFKQSTDKNTGMSVRCVRD